MAINFVADEDMEPIGSGLKLFDAWVADACHRGDGVGGGACELRPRRCAGRDEDDDK